MSENNIHILPKELVAKWLNDLFQYEYSITIYPKGKMFPERFVRTLTDKYEVHFNEDKIVVVSNDPIVLAELSLILDSQGYLVN